MTNYEKLIKRVENVEPFPAIFKIATGKGYYGENDDLKFRCDIPGKALISKPTSDDELIHNLVEENTHLFFNRSSRDVRMDKQNAIDNSLRDVKSDLINAFLKVSPNLKPKLTGIYKKLNKMQRRTFCESQNDLLINVWLYSQKNYDAISTRCPDDEDKKHINNLHGLLGIVANRLIKM